MQKKTSTLHYFEKETFLNETIRRIMPAAGALLISLCFCQQSQSISVPIPFGKAKDSDKDGMALNAIPKIRLDKAQQSEFDTSLKNGNAYLNAGSMELAQICFMRCTTLNPSSAEAHMGLACCYSGVRKTQQAQEEIFEALRCDANHADSRFLLGQIMMADQRWDEAGGQFLQVLKTQPENLGARGNLATCLQMMGQRDASIAQYKYILEKDPKLLQAANNLAAAYESKNMFDDAALYYKKVIEIDTNNANAYCSLSKCLMAKKDYKSAQVLLSHAASIAPNNHYVHLMQGYLNEAQRDKRAAIEEYTKAVALAPSDLDSQKALQRMLDAGINNRQPQRNPGLSQIGGLKLNTH